MAEKMLRELKRKLLQEKMLNNVWDYFMTHCGEKEFLRLGAKADHPMVEAVVAQVSKQLYPKDEIKGIMLTRIPEHGFVHGYFIVGAARIGGVIYFEEVDVGMLAVGEPPPSEDVKFARFSSSPPRGKTSIEPSVN